MTPLRIALLTHSTNPRGGVAHALALGEALSDRGHAVIVFAPDVTGRGFSRAVRCATHLIPAQPCDGTLLDLVTARAKEYVDHFEQHAADFDIYHAQDGISGNALATLAGRGGIESFVRTVHHLDDFADPAVAALQDRSVRTAARVICVSRLWAEQIKLQFGLQAEMIFNGVDLHRFTPKPIEHDRQITPGDGPIFLSIGGIELRKNSLNILRAFRLFHAAVPSARLLIAGGATLLDHGAYRTAFLNELAASALATRDAVSLLGVIADADMPALLRQADALVFPSIKEGFGLVVLEAMACGTPAVVSRIAPFTEYLAPEDCAWCDPTHPPSIHAAMQTAVTHRQQYTARGLAVAQRFPWSIAARKHEALYQSLLQEPCHAANEI